MDDGIKILLRDLKELFPKCDVFKIKLFGNPMLLIGKKEKGAIATQEQYENFETSYAYLRETGDIMQYGVKIGTKKDIEFL